MGEVWRATHQLLARQAAIKLIRPEALGGDAQTREIAMARLEREAQATASLRSPHTIAVYDFGASDTGTFYYVMELLVGYDAQQLVERFGPLPVERVVHLLAQVCDSLSEAHAARLVHRDIKPSNIYVCRYGRQVDFVKVLDFGLVKRVRGFDEDQTQQQLTAPHVISGTPAFMAPEQVLDDDTDARTDLYAVGCVAFWLLTGRTVFRGSTVMEVLMQHVRDEPLPPSRCSERPVPAALDAVILRCLAKSPDDRPQSADELAEALTAACDPRAWTPARASEWWRLRSGE
jgi:serine/threonine-protein kinase